MACQTIFLAVNLWAQEVNYGTSAWAWAQRKLGEKIELQVVLSRMKEDLNESINVAY